MCRFSNWPAAVCRSLENCVHECESILGLHNSQQFHRFLSMSLSVHRSMVMLLWSVCTVVCVLTAVSAVTGQSVVVNTRYGALRGTRTTIGHDSYVDSFYNIPFAKPPIGNNNNYYHYYYYNFHSGYYAINSTHSTKELLYSCSEMNELFFFF